MKQLVARSLETLDDHITLTAAVSTHFDPFEVLHTESLLDDDRVEAIDVLAAVCDEVDVDGSSYRHWSMASEARQHVLQTMATKPDFRAQLDAIRVRPDDLFAQYLVAGLKGADLSTMLPTGSAPNGGARAADGAVRDLDALLRAVRFLDVMPAFGPATRDLERRVRRQIALNEADKALQTVVPARLLGRDREYAALLDYRAATLPTDGDWVPTFLLVGPGGVGKSALVSQFVSDQRRQAGAAPLVYLDFDRATLVAATPMDLTFELTRQLGLADASLEQALSEFRARSRSLLGGREYVNIDIGAGSTSSALLDLASILSGWIHRRGPITIVLDTFEEVAIRGVTPVRDVLEWVASLRDNVRLEQIHVIVSGRAVVPDAPHLPPGEIEAMFNVHREWELEDLAPDSATELLTMLGVGSDLAHRCPLVFGGNPLVLKLIHRFVQANEPEDVEQLVRDGEKARRDAPTGEVGLRFVYERILNRIKSPRVQALAYPGVVLRRVTPELILVVLAPTCHDRLDVRTLADAQAAFTELAEHVWLVNRIATDTVVHRADMRRLLVPGLEHSTEVDTRAIHRAAATYYAGRPASVSADVSEVEEFYHRGFLDDIPQDMPERQAQHLARELAGDLGFWPVRARATVKALAGRHSELSEEEVRSLDQSLQRHTRGARIEKQVSSWDIDSAAFEEAQLGQLDEDAADTEAAIPDPRWALLFDRGDFDFMAESSRVLSAFDRYFVGDRSDAPSASRTHEHPWFIALAILLVDRGEQPLFSDAALAALDSTWDELRWYAAALAAVAGDRSAHARIMERIRRSIPPALDLPRVDDIIICQAAASGGQLDELTTTFQTFSADHFRLSHLVTVATAASDVDLARHATTTIDRYALERPDTSELNRFRESLARSLLELGGPRAVRAAPTTLSCLYGAIRTIAAQLDRTALLDVVEELQQRSVFWPVDLTAAELERRLRATFTPSDLTAIIEMADRCGLIVDLIDAISTRRPTRLATQLTAGIRRIEGLLVPYALPRVELLGVR